MVTVLNIQIIPPNVDEIVPYICQNLSSLVGDTWSYRHTLMVQKVASYCMENTLGNRVPKINTVIISSFCMICDYHSFSVTPFDVLERYNSITGQNMARLTIKSCLNAWNKEKDAIFEVIKNM